MQVWLAKLPGQPRALVTCADGVGARPAPPPLPPRAATAGAPPGADTATGTDAAFVFSMEEGRVAVSQLAADAVSWNGLRRLATHAHGCLGAIAAGGDTFLVVVTGAERVGSVVPGAPVWCVRAVAFFGIGSARWDALTPEAESEHPLAAVQRYLTSGSFYFADNYDLTSRVQSPTSISARFASPYAWNAFLAAPLLEFRARLDDARTAAFDKSQLLLLVIQGHVGVQTMHPDTTLALISRLSARKAGTRFNARGVDDQGYAAGFAETETIFTAGAETMSIVLLRGSVPVFWEQQGLQIGARIQLTRSEEAAQPAFARHMHKLLAHDPAVFVLDLLGTRDAESTLSDAYVAHINALHRAWDADPDAPAGGTRALRHHHFDFYALSRELGGLEHVRPEFERLNNVQNARQAFGYTVISRGAVTRAQSGVFRVNCFDCLDRTNVVQSFISYAALRDYVRTDPGRVLALHSSLWAMNGDALARISTGTGTLNSSLVTGGKRSLMGKISDAARSANRLYVNNFQDAGKQEAIEILLGARAAQAAVRLCDPVHDEAERLMHARAAEYATVASQRVFVGTYNLCAQQPGALDEWLVHARGADIAAVTLQEIVPLTAQQMLLSASETADACEAAIVRALGADTYIVLRREVLFATMLVVLIRRDALQHVHRVEGATKKTGMRGMSGNKGGVAIRMDVRDTGVAFVGAHLTSGGSNVEERHADAAAIEHGLTFAGGRALSAHDHVFWAGDLNYRIDEPDSTEVRRLAALAEGGDATAQSRLFARDQLAQAISTRRAFAEYCEAPLTFAPTYKYDIGTRTYDSSEKMRPPAWTDRVLFRQPGTLRADALAYDRTEMYASDHRPVCAVFEMQVCDIDANCRAKVHAEALAAVRATRGSGAAVSALCAALCDPSRRTAPAPSVPPARTMPRERNAPPPTPPRTQVAPQPPPRASQWWLSGELSRPSGVQAPDDVGNPFPTAPSPALPTRQRTAPPVPQRPHKP